MIDESPREWAGSGYMPTTLRPQFPARLTPGQWFVRHGLWIVLVVVVTVWEVLGFVFPVLGRKRPEWWSHPTLSQEIKGIIGTSLPGRIIATCVMVGLSAILTLHWAWRIPG